MLHRTEMDELKNIGKSEKDRFAWHSASFNVEIASVRIRCLQVIHELHRIGVCTEKFNAANVSKYTGVIFSKAYREEDLLLARNLTNSGVKIIFDICDNHIYVGKPTEILNDRLRRFTAMMHLADVIVCSTPTLATQVIAELPNSSSKIFVIPDMIDNLEPIGNGGNIFKRYLNTFHEKRLDSFFSAHLAKTRLVWFGNHGVSHASSGMSELLGIKNYLEEAGSKHSITLTIISNSYRKYLNTFKGWELRTLYIPWARETFSNLFRKHHVALLPNSRNPFTVAKSINRPCTAIMSGLGVIADSIPSYEELGQYIWLDDWNGGLEHYCLDLENQLSKIREAKKYILDKYSGAVVAEMWASLFQRLILDKPRFR